MKKYILLWLVFTATGYSLFAQYKNALKMNLSGIAVRNISLQYERKISPRLSLAFGFRDIPFGKLPFSTTISNLVDNPYVEFNRMNIGSVAVTPELRFYPNKKAMKGFYFGPFLSLANYKTDLPIDYNGKTGFFKGSVQTFTGGIQLGAQFKITNHFSLDWWIIGPNFGFSKGNLNFDGNLSVNEQIILRSEIEQIKKDVPFQFIDSYSVSDNNAIINIKGPWAGLRGLGINLAYHF